MIADFTSTGLDSLLLLIASFYLNIDWWKWCHFRLIGLDSA
jgi:hypothetical protein